MPWIAPTVAHVDRKGCLFCVACKPELADEPREFGYPAAVSGDQWFGVDDKCEQCCEQLTHVGTKDYIHVDY